jgi:hypothetical protein
MKRPVLPNIILTLLIVSIYLAIPRAWDYFGYPYRFVAADIFLLIVFLIVVWIWHFDLKRAIMLVAGVILFTAIWVQILFYFPYAILERFHWLSPWLLVLAPILLTPFVGLMDPKEGPLLAALMIAIANSLLFPSGLVDPDANSIDALSMYSSPSFPIQIAFLTILTALALGGGCLGAKLRLAVSN